MHRIDLEQERWHAKAQNTRLQAHEVKASGSSGLPHRMRRLYVHRLELLALIPLIFLVWIWWDSSRCYRMVEIWWWKTCIYVESEGGTLGLAHSKWMEKTLPSRATYYEEQFGGGQFEFPTGLQTREIHRYDMEADSEVFVAYWLLAGGYVAVCALGYAWWKSRGQSTENEYGTSSTPKT